MRILVLQHHRAEHPGIFRDFMAEDGIEWHPVHVQEGEPLPALSAYHAIIAMGGPMDTWEEDIHPWLASEKEYIRDAVVHRRMPFLGCCLGHQLLAEATGGRCEPMATPEVGVLDISLTDEGRNERLFQGVSSVFKAVQWHGAAVTGVPADGAVLAESPLCAMQAIRIGDRAWGIQFHVEATDRTMDEWGEIPAYAEALEKALGPGALPGLRAEVERNLADFEQNARAVYNAFRDSMNKS